MGCWGMGITQSDEYCEIYERFMEEYDEGKPLIDIKQDILDEYLEEFDEDDGVLHDVYFAVFIALRDSHSPTAHKCTAFLVLLLPLYHNFVNISTVSKANRTGSLREGAPEEVG